MKAIIFLALVFVAFLLLLGQAQISFKPFSFSLPYWHRSLGALLLVAGFVIYTVGECRKAYDKGVEDGITAIINKIHLN